MEFSGSSMFKGNKLWTSRAFACFEKLSAANPSEVRGGDGVTHYWRSHSKAEQKLDHIGLVFPACLRGTAFKSALLIFKYLKILLVKGNLCWSETSLSSCVYFLMCCFPLALLFCMIDKKKKICFTLWSSVISVRLLLFALCNCHSILFCFY